MMRWLRKAYSGFLWPWLAFMGGTFHGVLLGEHGWVRYLAWPCLVVGLFGLNVAQQKIRKRGRS